MFQRMRSTYHEFPTRFWVLVGASFVDRVGGTIIMPFFALYVTQRFGVGMTQAGMLFAVFSVAGFFGNMIGGGLTDRFGRKAMVLFGLVFSALSSVSMGLVDELGVFFLLAAVVGLLSDVAGPAHGAMVADMLPEAKRAEGFGILRVAGNLAWIVGPSIGGLLAARSFLLLFILDAISSLITAVIVARMIPETRPERTPEQADESMGRTFLGYRRVLADRGFTSFLAIAVVMNVVYIQMYSTLSVYLRDVHGVPTQAYGLLMSLNAGLVVLTQFSVTRWTRVRPPLTMMALGAGFYLVGFTMYGLVATYALFVTAMLLITVGEMVVIPVSQALVARFAPVDMRGRYMAVFGISWGIPSAIGPWAAGIILDNHNPNLVWYLAGILSAAAVAGFLALHARIGRQLEEAPAPAAAAAD